jgi:cell division protein FtsL
MARSAAAARAPRTDYGRSGRAAAKKPARRASGRADRNAEALRRAAAVHKSKPAPARAKAASASARGKAASTSPRTKATRAKAAPAKARQPRKAAMPRGRGPAVAAAVASVGSVALPMPLRVIRAPFTRGLRTRGNGVIDALLRGRAWIALVAVLLVGIVFFNVDLLKLNRDIAATAQRASGVQRENARLRLAVARLDGSERVQTAAAEHGLLLSAPGDVRYLRANPLVDATHAAKMITAPDSSQPAPDPTPQSSTPQAATPTAAPQQTTTPQATATPTPAPAQPQAAPTTQTQTQPQPQTQAQPGATTQAPTG